MKWAGVEVSNALPLPVARLSARELGQAYKDNGVAADDSYKWKYLEITGIVDRVTVTFGVPGLSLDSESVICLFRRKDGPALALLRVGQQVRVRGVCAGLTLFSPTLNDCTLVP